MDKTQLKEQLRQKITSADQLRAIFNNCGLGYRNTPNDHYLMPDGYPNAVTIGDHYIGRVRWDTESYFKETWWYFREQARLATSLYPPRTDVMQQVIHAFALAPYCIHCSTDPETPYAVAYTPDGAMGQADRQVKVSSFAKLLKKLVILITDEHAGKLEAMHRAEMDPSFEIAATPEEIEYVYRNMSGDGGCMRYEGKERWGLPEGFHPSHVYASPGVAVAYHKVGDRIVSRAVIFETAEGTKHWLRIYGDAALRRKLQRNGYTERSMVGVKLKAIKLPAEDHGEHHYMLPYIDGVGGAQGDYNGVCGYIDKADPDHVQLVSRERYEALRNAGIEVRVFKDHMTVSHKLIPQDLSSLRFTCPLSGIEVDRTKDSISTVWYAGKVQRVASTPYVSRRFAKLAKFYDRANDIWVTMGCEANTPDWKGYYEPHAIEVFNLVRLDPAYYPEDRAWYKRESVIEIQGKLYLPRDVVQVYDSGLAMRYILRSEVSTRQQRAAHVKEGYAIVPAGAGQIYLIKPDHVASTTLYDGTVIHRGKHDTVELYDGTLSLHSGARKQTILGREVWVPRTKAFTVDYSKFLDKFLGSVESMTTASNDQIGRSKLSYYGADLATRLKAHRDNAGKVLKQRATKMLRQIISTNDVLAVDSNGVIVTEYLSSWNDYTWEMAEPVRAAFDAGAARSEYVLDSAVELFKTVFDHATVLIDTVRSTMNAEIEVIERQITEQIAAAEALADDVLGHTAATGTRITPEVLQQAIAAAGLTPMFGVLTEATTTI